MEEHKVTNKCIGIIGRLFGHKFFKMNYNEQFDHCVRCGMPVGGWKK